MIWQLIGGFLARFWQPIAAAIAGWKLARQRETIRDLRDEQAARDRMDKAPRHSGADAARDSLRARAAKRDLRGD